MAGKNGRGRSAVPFASQVKAFKLLEESLIKEGEGRVVFKDGWSDDRISEGAGISRALAANIRLKNFGALAKHPPTQKRTSVRDEINDLKVAIDADRSHIRILTSEVRSLWELVEKLMEKKDA
jgi:hypothetical protein